jgi:integrase
MTGSMREKSEGTWEIRFEIGPDPANGRRRQLTRVVHGTQKQAHAALRREITAVGAGNYRGTSTKFNALCATWLNLQSHNLGPAKVRSYESLLNSMVMPTLGKKSLNLVRAADLDALYKKLALRKRLGPIEVSAVHDVVWQAFIQAEKWGWLGTNPALEWELHYGPSSGVEGHPNWHR